MHATMSRSPQDLYARLLSPTYGYPLWTPEPSNEFLAASRPEGLRIGDVGVVTPEDGGFDALFNLCLPRNHRFHIRYGVPESFTHFEPEELDIKTIPSAEPHGQVILTPSVTRVRTVSSTEAPQRDVSGVSTYRFNLSSDKGALLILPEGAERHELLNDGLFVQKAGQNAAEWYNYAMNRRHRMISQEALYVITGLCKTRSWSVAALENVAGNESYVAHYKHIPDRSSTTPMYGWETTRACLHWRAGTSTNYGSPSQTVFIRGLKIALRNGFLGHTQVSVKADTPSKARSNFVKLLSVVPSNSWVRDGLASLMIGDRGNTSRINMHTGLSTDAAKEQAESNMSDQDGHEGMHVEIQRVPNVPSVFHPSNAINQYLLHKDPSMNIAITSDRIWMSILEDKLLTTEDFDQGFHLEKVLSQNYDIVSQEGVMRLERRKEALVDKQTHSRSSIPRTSDPNGAIVQLDRVSQVSASRDQKDADKQSKGDHLSSSTNRDDIVVTNQPNTVFGRSRSRLSTNVYHAGSINRDDIVIVVMGPTGVGKSSFVNKAAGRIESEIGNGLRSKTQKVQPVRCRHPDGRRDIVLVDTPGFDDIHLSDSQILRIIAEWMKKTYQNGIKLSGLLYLQRISDAKMAGTAERSLAVFKDLCGAENMRNVVLVTTMWDEVEDTSVGEMREKQLISNFWQDMISLGSRTCRSDGTSESAWEIINRLDLKTSRPMLTPLKIQKEMVDHHVPFQNTTAATTLLQSLVADFKKVRVKSLVEARQAASPRKTFENRSFRPLRRSSAHKSTSSASFPSAVSDSTDMASVLSFDSGYASLDRGTSSGCHPNGRRNTLQTMVSGLRQVMPIAELISNTVLRKSITTVLHTTQHIERMGGGGTHHAIGHVLESSGWLLQGIVQYAAKSKLSKDMKKPLVSFQDSLVGLQKLVMDITKRNPTAPFFLQDEHIAVLTVCITSIKEIYNKPNLKLSIDNHCAIAFLDNQLNALCDISVPNKCECGISVVPEEE